MLTIIVPIYFALCLLTSFNGRSTRYGFGGMLFASIILTPIIVGIGLILFGMDRKPTNVPQVVKEAGQAH